jgi:carbon-monoxide dehydrogenase medium subunit
LVDAVKPAPFTYHRAESVSHAVSLLHDLGDEASLIAGGQSLGPMLNLRVARPAHLIDLNDLRELDSVRLRGQVLELGSMIRHHRLATDREIATACPILQAAAATIGNYAIRQRGTLGGSLSHADPAAQLPLIATLLDTEIVLAGQDSTRSVPARRFFLGSLTTALRRDEIITAVRFPVIPPGTGWGFELFAQRYGDFAVAAAGVIVAVDCSGRAERVSVALGGMAAMPLALDDIVQPFLGRRPDPGWRADVAGAVALSTAPEDDRRIPARYRQGLAAVLIERALATAVNRAGAVSP